LKLIETRWLTVNIITAFLLFIIVLFIVGWFMVYGFKNHYYISLDELPLTLLITIIFAISLSAIQNKKAKTKENKSLS